VIPQAKNSMCVLDEVASLVMDDQKWLFGAMEEGKFTVDKSIQIHIQMKK
jgi:sigma54-dependent transcription regulator